MSDQTTQFYDQTAPEWSATHINERFWGIYMDAFFNLLEKGKVLEIGAGGGRDAKELIEHGYGYEGTDPSAGMVSVAQQNNPGATFRQIRVQDLDYDKEFEGFWASASLLHIPKSEIDEALKRIHNALKENGVGFISIKKHVDDLPAERVEDRDGGKRLFVYWTHDEFAEILKRNGFETVEFYENPMSEKTVWLIFLVRKVSEK